MANMSNDFIRVSRGYANVQTQFGFQYSTYCELWGSAICHKYTLKVRISAPKGYKVDTIDSNIPHEITPSWIIFPNTVARDWDIDTAVQLVCATITVRVDRIVNGPLGIVVTNSSKGIVAASCGRFVSYADCLEAYNLAMDLADKGDIVTVTLSTEDEAEECIAMIANGDEHMLFFDSAELCWGIK